MISANGVLKRAATIAQQARRRGFDIQMSRHDNAASRL
jgi:hypothetical protein